MPSFALVRCHGYLPVMPDAWPLPDERCPHGFSAGTVEGARRSFAEWPDRNERAACIFCGELVDLADLKASGTSRPGA